MRATVTRPGESEVDSATRRFGLSVLAAHEKLVLSALRLPPGVDGPAAHVHHEHSDGFYVLEGELSVLLGSDWRPLTAGGLVVIPPGVVHTVRNDSETDVLALNLHAPGAGFEAYVQAGRDGDDAARERFDQAPPPEDGGRPASDATVAEPCGGETVALGPSRALFKVTGDDGQGSISVSESTIAPGFPGPVPHRHRTFVDSFYVLEGTLTLRVGDDSIEAEAGTYALVPPGVVHTFSNPGDSAVRFLNIMAPGGFEGYLREVAAQADPGAPPDPALMAEIASRYDFEPAA